MGVTIKLRGDTAANWLTANPVLAAREVGLELDTQLYKVGDGVSNWDSLTYWGQMPAHNHNDQYYTEEEIDGLLNGVSAEPDAGIWIWINQFEVANNPSANGSNVLVQCDAVQTWGDQPVGEIDLFGVRILQAGYYRIGCGALLYSPEPTLRSYRSGKMVLFWPIVTTWVTAGRIIIFLYPEFG